MAHSHDPSAPNTVAGRLRVQGQLGLHSEFKASVRQMTGTVSINQGLGMQPRDRALAQCVHGPRFDSRTEKEKGTKERKGLGTGVAQL